MKSSKKKKAIIKKADNVTVAPCKVYRYRVKFADKTAPDLMSPPYAFGSDKDAMTWLSQTAERLLDDVKARYVSITCYSLASCDDRGVMTFTDDLLVGTITREEVLSALSLKLEGYKNV